MGNVRTLLGEDVSRYSIRFAGTYVSSDQDEVKRLSSHSEVEEKLLIRRVCSDLTATFDGKGFFYTKNLYGLLNSSGLSLKYLLGVINSRLMNFFFKKYFTTKKKDIFPEFQKYQLDNLPIRVLNLDDSGDKDKHDKVVRLVEQFLTAQGHLSEAHTDRDKSYYENKCVAVDNQINRLVYELYGLTDEEVAIVEEA